MSKHITLYLGTRLGQFGIANLPVMVLIDLENVVQVAQRNRPAPFNTIIRQRQSEIRVARLVRETGRRQQQRARPEQNSDLFQHEPGRILAGNSIPSTLISPDFRSPVRWNVSVS